MGREPHSPLSSLRAPQFLFYFFLLYHTGKLSVPEKKREVNGLYSNRNLV
ncbi:MAG: hypothetical protein PWP57_533 [Candidatus Atribacteria bacterium]|nr:hypothetical protein [Candidatus Atribacteria bacterium]